MGSHLKEECALREVFDLVVSSPPLALRLVSRWH